VVAAFALGALLGAFAVGNALAGGDTVCTCACYGCGGGGPPPHVDYTYEGPDDGVSVNGTGMATGNTIVLQEGVPVSVYFRSDPGVITSWASAGGGSFSCPGCHSTTFTPGAGGYIYTVVNQGSSANWGGYLLTTGLSQNVYTAATLELTLPTEASVTGPPGSVAAFWVGVGGANSIFYDSSSMGYPFWQAGVDIEETSTGPVMFPWYEAFESASNYDLVAVVVTAPVLSWGGTVYINLSFGPAGGYVCFSHTYCYEDSRLQGSTGGNVVEWIVEAPTLSDGSYATIPDFGSTQFSQMQDSSVLTGGLYSLVLDTCWSGGTCGDPGQTIVPGAFLGSGFSDGFAVSYSGGT
jgi:Peptidase A4 family